MIIFFQTATLDGGLGYCLPLPEKTYRRLFMLQNVLFLHIEHLCGLNPKQYRFDRKNLPTIAGYRFNHISIAFIFRTIKTGRRLPMNPSRCIVDGDLIWSYVSLPVNEKQEVAKKIGTKMEEIIADLIEIENATSIF